MALQGTLSYLDIAHLLQVVGTAKKSGILQITWETWEARLFFHSGRLVRAESNRGTRKALGVLLVDAGIVSSEDRDLAVEMQAAEGEGRRFGTLLCEEFGLSAAEIERVLRRQFEQVVFDVFGWPGGTFRFDFGEPEEMADRFHLNPSDFILQVGVQAGLLAEEGIEREQSDPNKPPVLFYSDDPELFEDCTGHWYRLGHRVTSCEEAGEIFVYLTEWTSGGDMPIVVVDLSSRVDGTEGLPHRLAVLERLRDQNPEIPVIALGDHDAAGLRMETRTRGALAYVRKPDLQELNGPQGQTLLEVFFMTLDKAFQMGSGGHHQGDAEEGA